MKTKMNFFGMGLVIALLIFTSCSKENEEPVVDYSNAKQEETFSVKSMIQKKSFEKGSELDEKELNKILTSIEILYKMEYPIKNDKQLYYALKEFNNLEFSQSITKDFNKSDFPIKKVEDAFRIHYDNNTMYDWVRPIFPKLPELSPDLPDFDFSAPGACEIYSRDFPAAAATCGCQVYASSIRGGLNHLQATIAGIFAARRFLRTGECW